MPTEDFDIDRLAAYLHLSPQKVSRLADRGKLPGRKVGGQWRFSRAEVHHWLEERIGLADEEELVNVEGVLREHRGPEEAENVVLADLLLPEAIAVPLAARTRNAVIRAMVDLAAGTGYLWDPEKMNDAVREREDMQSTAMENGVALLHPRRPMPGILGQPFMAFGRTSSGIPFGGGFGNLTDVFFLICSVDDRGHLRTLARLARVLGLSDVLGALRAAEDIRAVQRVIAEAEMGL
ncbi:MAG: PTS transporter subunit EIIA [Planctomycetaceae bacterium]|nr:PTS transporter subunit EIIA [Planctomycetaceae bacterium]